MVFCTTCILITTSSGTGSSTERNPDRLGYEYLSPLPGAELVTKDTRIIIRPGEKLSSASVNESKWLTVIGEASGQHQGRIYVASDQKTIVFNPDKSFIPNELVAVQVQKGLYTEAGKLVPSIEYSFQISPKTKQIRTPTEIWYDRFLESEIVYTRKEISEETIIHGVSVPTDFPPLNITKINNPSKGSLFFAPFIFPDPKGAMSYVIIMDNDGRIQYYQRDPHPAGNFTKLWNGNISFYWYGTKTHYIMDSTYTVIDSINTVGYETDGHEFKYLENKHVILISYDRQYLDMSQIIPGGNPKAIVEGAIIQELDENRELVFEWRSWDYFEITDAIDSIDLTEQVVDYAHTNSINVDVDGNLIISSRNFNECTKISRTTGDIIWRMGGTLCRNNEFKFIDDQLGGFCYQHDFHRVGDNYLVFDNASSHFPPIPRAVEYAVDEDAKTAILVWERLNYYPVRDSHMGNARRLPNGNTLINWGGSFLGYNNIRITEVNPAGDVEFEMTFGINRYKTYRVYRYDWHGQAKVPYLVVEMNPYKGVVILTYNVFGDAKYNKYNIYHGTTSTSTNIMMTTKKNQVEITDLENGIHYFRVTAVDSNGTETGYSNGEKIEIVWADADKGKNATNNRKTVSGD